MINDASPEVFPEAEALEEAMVGDRARILVVDDNASLRRSLTELLTRSGYEVIQAADGSEAGRVWRAVEVDLVILDLFMPEKDGIETMVELRAFAPGIPIIVMSGGAADGSPIDMLNAAELLGACQTIQKPFTLAEMLEAVRKALPATD
jgi:two-component system, chemotaxis family, chemotaxis protein CheY